MFARRTSAMLVAIILTLTVAGCAPGSDAGGAGTTTPDQVTPSERPSAQEPASEQAAQGEELVNQKCTMCHTLDRVRAAQFDEEGWTATVSRMQQNGLVVTETEKSAIIEYLAQRDAAR